MEYSSDQVQAYRGITKWLTTSSGHTTLGGYAGTGKTTLIRALVEFCKQQRLRVVVVSFTGKAVSVLLSKGIPAQTLHSLLYILVGGPPDSWLQRRHAWRNAVQRHMAAQPDRFHFESDVEQAYECGDLYCEAYREWCEVREQYSEDDDGQPKWQRVSEVPADVVIVDESSMINHQYFDDLIEVCPRVLFVGDHGQLEPIGSNPRLMEHPQFRLEQIHRQAADSYIIQFAHHVRQGHHPIGWQSSADVRISNDYADAAGHDVVICGFNEQRCGLNHVLREMRGFTSEHPMVGECVICLRNNPDYRLFNGFMTTILSVRPRGTDTLRMRVPNADGEEVVVDVLRSQFGAPKMPRFLPRNYDLFDWGYAITCHKAQGSEFNSVAVCEQIASSWSPMRWRYTAATRAVERLTYINGG